MTVSDQIPESQDEPGSCGGRRPASCSPITSRLVFAVAGVFAIAISPVGTCIVAAFHPEPATMIKVIVVQVVLAANVIVWGSIFDV